MAFRLIPRDEAFWPLFDESAQIAADCASHLRRLLQAPPVQEADVDVIVNAERRGDEIGRAVRDRIEHSIVTPFDREDIQALTTALDDVTDEIRAAADMSYLHKITSSLPLLDELTQKLVDITTLNVDLVGRLKSLRGVGELADRIDAVESEADAVYRRITADLFSGAYDALEILRWNEVIAAIERAIDAVEWASDIIVSIAVKHA